MGRGGAHEGLTAGVGLGCLLMKSNEKQHNRFTSTPPGHRCSFLVGYIAMENLSDVLNIIFHK